MIRTLYLQLDPRCAARRRALRERLHFVIRVERLARAAVAAEARLAELQRRCEQARLSPR